IWPTAPFNPPIKPLILSPDSGISKTKRSSNVISPNGLLSSLWVWQHKDESNPFLFATQNSSHHVLFEQRLIFDCGFGKDAVGISFCSTELTTKPYVFC